MRYALTFFLGALCLIAVGFSLGFISIDFSAPSDRQLSAAGVLAWWHECDDCDDGEGTILPDGSEVNLSWDFGPGYYREDVTTFFPDDSMRVDSWEYDPYRDRYGYEVGELDGDGAIAPDPIYYDPWYDPRYEYERSGGYWVDEWVEYYPSSYEKEYVSYRDPWYVRAFPGFGQVAERIIPGSQWWNQPRPSPAPRPPQPPPRPVYSQPSCWISAQPTTVQYGGSTVLHWESFNASNASLSDFGTVQTSGSRTTPPLSSERIFSLSVSGQGGSGSCYTRITVQPPSGAAPSCVISAHPSTISRGETSSLAWGSNNASSALLSGVGAVGTNGGMYVAPLQSTTYTLAVYGSQNRSNTCTTQIGVLP